MDTPSVLVLVVVGALGWCFREVSGALFEIEGVCWSRLQSEQTDVQKPY